MILSQFISNLKTGVLENYGTLLTDDNQLIFTTSNMINYIYSYRVRKWALVREELTSLNNVYTLSNTAVHVIKVQSGDIEYKPTPMPFDLTDSNIVSSTKYFSS